MFDESNRISNMVQYSAPCQSFVTSESWLVLGEPRIAYNFFPVKILEG